MGNPKSPLDPAAFIPRRFQSSVSTDSVSVAPKDRALLRSTDMADLAVAAELSAQNPPTSRNTTSPCSENHGGTAVLGDIDPSPGISSTSLQSQVPSNSSAPPRTPVTQGNKASTEPLTISLKSDLLRKARILAASKSITLSKLIGRILAAAVDRELPAVVAGLQETKEGEDQ